MINSNTFSRLDVHSVFINSDLYQTDIHFTKKNHCFSMALQCASITVFPAQIYSVIEVSPLIILLSPYGDNSLAPCLVRCES